MKDLYVKIFNIDYDTDGDIEIENELPDEFETTISMFDDEGDDELVEYISDYISDETGYCHKGFEYEILHTYGHRYDDIERYYHRVKG